MHLHHLYLSNFWYIRAQLYCLLSVYFSFSFLDFLWVTWLLFLRFHIEQIMLVHTYNSSTQEPGAGGLWVWDLSKEKESKEKKKRKKSILLYIDWVFWGYIVLCHFHSDCSVHDLPHVLLVSTFLHFEVKYKLSIENTLLFLPHFTISLSQGSMVL
jgi:hypothetical protein